jgi:hypothetical protein
MCVKCKGHPSCLCPCTFVTDMDFFLTFFVFRGIPIIRTVCKRCGHRPGQRSGYKVRVGSGHGP